MNDILQLEDFSILELQIKWHPGSPDANRNLFADPDIDYHVFQHTEKANCYMLRLICNIESGKLAENGGLEISSEICGWFNCPEGIKETDHPTVVRINGGMILYGILRGQIAAWTGSFPGGQCLLPTLNFRDIVERVETARTAEADSEAPQEAVV